MFLVFADAVFVGNEKQNIAQSCLVVKLKKKKVIS